MIDGSGDEEADKHPPEAPAPEPSEANRDADAEESSHPAETPEAEGPDPPPRPIQRSAPQSWPLAHGTSPASPRPAASRPEPRRTAPRSMPIGAPPPPPYQGKPPTARSNLPVVVPQKKRRRSLLARMAILSFKAVAIFVIGSILWVAAYRFIAPPFTLTMAGDVIAGRGVTKRWMPLSRIDPDMARAAIAGEDGNFCAHNGFEWAAIRKAIKSNASGKKRIRGGSTISQQTAKNVFLWQGGGYFRKGLEAWFTVLIENIWGKRRIMEVYLNVAETGIGTYGVDAGAIRYFRHDASRLSVQEAAAIAAVLPLPKKRAAIDPRGFTRRYGRTLAARIPVVRGSGYDSCLR